jgi:alpha-amylase
MVDIVFNHVGAVDLDFSQITTFPKAEYYHSKCQVEDYNNQTQVELCRLANLPDLNQVLFQLMLYLTSTESSFCFQNVE